MILVIDNYDSFVYNLARYVGELGYSYKVCRNDEINLPEIKKMKPTHIIISPGPCSPNEAGISLALISEFHDTIPILGVCLGHQAIGQVYGAQIVRAKNPTHGKFSYIKHDFSNIFSGLSNPLKVARYHSLAVSSANFPKCLRITAQSSDGEIMAIKHLDHHVYGVQFHPESILTSQGKRLLYNFLTCNVIVASKNLASSIWDTDLKDKGFIDAR
jgi:anthranilate synthase/aminodeoxychorismate synthase-like glutamine amidotransferase